MAPLTSSDPSTPSECEEGYSLDEYLGRDGGSPVSASARDEAAKVFFKLGADTALAGVKAGQSSEQKARTIGDILLEIILPLVILAVVLAALFIVFSFDPIKSEKLVETASGLLFSLPSLALGYFIGRHKAGAD